jgi:hypothetical protein
LSMRKTVVKVSKTGWRLTKKGEEEMMEQMGDKISGQTGVVFYGLEFFTKKTRIEKLLYQKLAVTSPTTLTRIASGKSL